MTRYLRAGRDVAVAGIIAFAAALLGQSIAPRQALAAQPMFAGYTCAPYDVCMPGAQTCCFEVVDIPPGSGRCSTMCPVS